MANITGDNVQLPEITTSDADKVVVVNSSGDDYTLLAQGSITASSTITIDSALSGSSTNPVQNSVINTALNTKQDTLTFNAPSSDNSNPSTSAQIKSALDNKQDSLTFNAPSSNNTNPSTSAQILTALNTKQDTLAFNAPSSNNSNPSTSAQILTALNTKQDSLTLGALNGNVPVLNENIGTNHLLQRNGTEQNFVGIGLGNTTGSVLQVGNGISGTRVVRKINGSTQFEGADVGNTTGDLVSPASNVTGTQLLRKVNGATNFEGATVGSNANCIPIINDVNVTNGQFLVRTSANGFFEGRTLSTATTSAEGLMSSADKTILDNLIKIVAFGKINTNGNRLRGSGLSSSRTSTGVFAITLDDARPNSNYSVFTSVIENSNNRDDIIATINSGSFTTTGFSISIHEGDNNTAAGTLVNRQFNVMVVDID